MTKLLAKGVTDGPCRNFSTWYNITSDFSGRYYSPYTKAPRRLINLIVPHSSKLSRNVASPAPQILLVDSFGVV